MSRKLDKVLMSLYKLADNSIYGIREVMRRKNFFQEKKFKN